MESMEKINTGDYISFIDIIRVLKKRKIFIAFVTILCTCIMVMKVVILSRPMYMASTTTILVKDSSNTANSTQYTASDINLYQQVAGTYEKIAHSDTVINKTADELKIYTPSQVRAMVSVVRDNETQIIQLNAESNDPKEAAKIAEIYCKNFIQESMSILPVAKIQVLDSAKEPTSAISNKASLMVVLGFIAGLVAAIGIVLIKYYIDSNKIRNEKQITSILNIPVLVSIE